jgi:hypothetical protein
MPDLHRLPCYALAGTQDFLARMYHIPVFERCHAEAEVRFAGIGPMYGEQVPPKRTDVRNAEQFSS